MWDREAQAKQADSHSGRAPKQERLPSQLIYKRHSKHSRSQTDKRNQNCVSVP